jgi:integrase
VLNWATAHGYREGENPARWKGHLSNLLAKPSKVSKTRHFAALPYREIHDFVGKLHDDNSTTGRALGFLILTATHSNEVRRMEWSEIEFTTGLWVIPGEKMKAKKQHRIPLSPRTLEILREIPQKNAYVFTGPSGKSLSENAFRPLLNHIEREDVTVHGMRSTFRDWAGESTAFAREIIEHALAHQLKDKSEAAYARGNLLEKRRKLMDAWSDYVGTAPSNASVTPISEAVR